MKDYTHTFREIEAQIDRYFASDASAAEKLRSANEMLKVLAKFNRETAEWRRIGKDARPSPRMPPDVIDAVMNDKYEIVEALYRYKWYKPDLKYSTV